MKNYRSTIVGFALLVVLLSAGAAQSLAGSNTVFTDDIVDGTIKHADIKPNTIGSSRFLDNSIVGTKIADNSIKGADVDEATLVPTCPGNLKRAVDVCYEPAIRPQALWPNAVNNCFSAGLRLPSLSEGMVVQREEASNEEIMTSHRWSSGGSYFVAIPSQSTAVAITEAAPWQYRCVTSVGAHP